MPRALPEPIRRNFSRPPTARLNGSDRSKVRPSRRRAGARRHATEGRACRRIVIGDGVERAVVAHGDIGIRDARKYARTDIGTADVAVEAVALTGGVDAGGAR